MKLLEVVTAHAEERQHVYLRQRADWPKVRFEFEPVTKELERDYGAKGGKVFVTIVQSAGAAATAGLHAGDVVAGLDGKGLKSAADLARAIYTAQSGTRLTLDVVREDGRHKLILALP